MQRNRKTSILRGYILGSLSILCSFLLTGCLGTGALKRGQDDGKSVLHTPSLHTVPERPAHAKANAENRKTLTQDMKQSFESAKEDL